MTHKETEEATEDLVSIGYLLKTFMREHKGRSAMVSTYVDDTGEVMLAANLYVGRPTARLDATTPAIEIRRKL